MGGDAAIPLDSGPQHPKGGENPPTQHILAPLLRRLRNPRLEAFLAKRVTKSERDFDIRWDILNISARIVK